MNRKYDDYVAFLISDRIAKKRYEEGFTCDEVWEECVEIAKEFETRERNDSNKPLYEEVEGYMDRILGGK